MTVYDKIYKVIMQKTWKSTIINTIEFLYLSIGTDTILIFRNYSRGPPTYIKTK